MESLEEATKAPSTFAGNQNDALYREDIADSMRHNSFLQLKRTYKLNDDDFDASNKDPCKKFDYIYKCIVVHNTNVLTKYADSDQCMDEITFGHAGYGPKGAGAAMRRLIGKKVTKGGQTVLCSDVGRNRVRAYSHRRKCHTSPGKEWGREGPCEARRIAETLQGMMIRQQEQTTHNLEGMRITNQTSSSDYRYAPKGIFREKPVVITAGDNYFGNYVFDRWMGGNGFGFLHTTRRDCLPAGVPD
jgi:hypothetical protein